MSQYLLSGHVMSEVQPQATLRIFSYASHVLPVAAQLNMLVHICTVVGR
jgi:hypothetical protein